MCSQNQKVGHLIRLIHNNVFWTQRIFRFLRNSLFRTNDLYSKNKTEQDLCKERTCSVFYNAFCFFGEFSGKSELTPEIREEFFGWNLDSNGIQAVVTMTDVSGAEIVEFLEQHLDFIKRLS